MDELEIIFHFIQDYIIKRLLGDIIILIQTGHSQADINKILGFIRLDDGSGKDFITRFYINRLIHQGIVNRPGTTNKGINLHQVDKYFPEDYQKPLFKLPGSSDSKLERFVYNLLKEKYPLSKIYTEYKFEDGRYFGSKSQFRYDFLLETTDGKQLLIETDGEQHFKFISKWHKTIEDFKEKQNRDKFKNDFCES